MSAIIRTTSLSVLAVTIVTVAVLAYLIVMMTAHLVIRREIPRVITIVTQQAKQDAVITATLRTARLNVVVHAMIVRTKAPQIATAEDKWQLPFQELV